jgi:hypothetical protein
MTRELKPCGTVAAYTRHILRGEPIDADIDARVREQIAAGLRRDAEGELSEAAEVGEAIDVIDEERAELLAKIADLDERRKPLKAKYDWLHRVAGHVNVLAEQVATGVLREPVPAAEADAGALDGDPAPCEHCHAAMPGEHHPGCYPDPDMDAAFAASPPLSGLVGIGAQEPYVDRRTPETAAMVDREEAGVHGRWDHMIDERVTVHGYFGEQTTGVLVVAEEHRVVVIRDGAPVEVDAEAIEQITVNPPLPTHTGPQAVVPDPDGHPAWDYIGEQPTPSLEALETSQPLTTLTDPPHVPTSHAEKPKSTDTLTNRIVALAEKVGLARRDGDGTGQDGDDPS